MYESYTYPLRPCVYGWLVIFMASLHFPAFVDGFKEKQAGKKRIERLMIHDIVAL